MLLLLRYLLMRTKNKYQQYLHEAGRALDSVAMRSEPLEHLQAELNSVELLIPVVGSFSAGKSSMLNSFIGRQVLPVGIRPETELAAELRFDTDERIEAITVNGDVQRFALDGFDHIRERAQDFRFLRVYLNSPSLQRIEPLVLVDMPGFGSAAINHNKAIGNYLARGAHFIAAISVEEGNITRSTESQLQDIVEMQRGISVVLTKANLKAEAEVREIADYVAEQASDITGSETPVHVIGGNAETINRMLDRIDPEQLFSKLFCGPMKDLHYNLLENANIAVTSLSNSTEDNQHAIDELSDAVSKIERKRDFLLEDIRQRFGTTSIDSIVGAVGRALTATVEDMVAALQAGDKARLERVVADTLRSTLLRKMKAQTNEISATVVHEFELELRGLDRIMSNYSSDGAWSSGLSQKLLDDVSKIQDNILRIGKTFDKENKLGNVFKTAATVLAIATNVVAPVVELLIVFLPDILPALFAGSVREKMRNTVMTDMIPAIQEELRQELPAIFEQQLEALVRQVGVKFEEVLRDKQDAIRQQEEAVRVDAVNVAERLASLQGLQRTLTTLAQQTIFEAVRG